MRNRYRVLNSEAAYFVTSTVVGWLPVFTSECRCNLLIESLKHCRAHKGLKLYAWVILDNHFHAILDAPDLSRVLADLKRHTAQQLLKAIEIEGESWLLSEFSRLRPNHKAECQHQVWQEGFHPQEISGDEMMLQKVDYIHGNPIRRGLVSAPEHWRYSSAHEFCMGAEPVLRCDPWQ